MHVKFIFAILAAFSTIVDAGKILVKPMGPGEIDTSHRLFMNALAETLSADGHSVSVLVREEFADNLQHTFSWITYNLDHMMLLSKEAEESVHNATSNCEILLSNKRLLNLLIEEDFDVVFVDDLSLCDFLLPHVLHKPFIVIGTAGFSVTVTDSPHILSYISSNAFSSYTDRMSFFQRVNNFIDYPMENLLFAVIEGGINNIGRRQGVLQVCLCIFIVNTFRLQVRNNT